MITISTPLRHVVVVERRLRRRRRGSDDDDCGRHHQQANKGDDARPARARRLASQHRRQGRRGSSRRGLTCHDLLIYRRYEEDPELAVALATYAGNKWNEALSVKCALCCAHAWTTFPSPVGLWAVAMHGSMHACMHLHKLCSQQLHGRRVAVVCTLVVRIWSRFPVMGDDSASSQTHSVCVARS